VRIPGADRRVADFVGAPDAKTQAWLDSMLGVAVNSPAAQLALTSLPEGVDAGHPEVAKVLDQIREASAPKL